jgi:hypothetical protein
MDRIASSDVLDDLPVYVHAILNAYEAKIDGDEDTLLIRISLGSGRDPRVPCPLFTLARLERMPADAVDTAKDKGMLDGDAPSAWVISFPVFAVAVFRSGGTTRIPTLQSQAIMGSVIGDMLRMLAQTFSTGTYIREVRRRDDLLLVHRDEALGILDANIGVPTYLGHQLVPALPPIPVDTAAAPFVGLDPGSSEFLQAISDALRDDGFEDMVRKILARAHAAGN